MVIPQVSSRTQAKKAISKEGCPIIAYIDMGTNSFHMIVCQAQPSRNRFEIISRVKHPAPFFRRSLTAHYIDEGAQQTCLRILQDMRKKAQLYGATQILAVATSAVRESRNGQEVLNRIRKDLAIDAKMISGREEARLIYLGVIWSMPQIKHKFGIVDIGGGSTEVITGDRSGIDFAESYKLGAARLSEQFFPKHAYTKHAIERLHELVHGVVQPAAAHLFNSGDIKHLIGTSGTIQALARLDRARAGMGIGDLHGWRLPAKRLSNYVAEIEKLCLAGEKIKGISSDRSHTILAGAIVLQEIMESLSFDEITVCTAALREGAVVNQLLQTGWLAGSLDEHTHPRRDSVHYLLRKYDASIEHANKVAYFAREIFFQTKGVLHNWPDSTEHLLWSAAMLHDVGTFIGRKGHHKHSYYLIKNAGLLGHSEEEVEMIAQIARYHRGNIPKETHLEYSFLPPDKRRLMKEMAAILRVSEALDRSHRQLIDNIQLTFAGEPNKGKPKQATLKITSKKKSSLDAELWALSQKKAPFEEAFGVKLTVT